jgi:hypothetical protein
MLEFVTGFITGSVITSITGYIVYVYLRPNIDDVKEDLQLTQSMELYNKYDDL